MRSRRPLSPALFTSALVLALGATLAAGCSDSDADDPTGAGGAGGHADIDAGSDADTDTDSPPDPLSPIEAVPVSETLEIDSLSAPVDLVRDEWGIPHIYGSNAADIAFAQGYIVARDRFPQLDFMRHNAGGTLGELAGVIQPQILQMDLNMRMHGFRRVAERAYEELKASEDPEDKLLVTFIERFADGVNEYLTALQAKKHKLPSELQFAYSAEHAKPWTAIDSLLLGQLQAYSLSFDAEREITATLLRAKAYAHYDEADEADSPDLAARQGLYLDLTRTAPLVDTFTIDGWTGFATTQSLSRREPRRDPALLEALESAQRVLAGTGMRERGSNNWVISPELSATGHALLANDPHLGLSNPATFYMTHLASSGEDLPLNAMGVSFPGIPGIILGMNEKLAWGATTSYADVTDVYEEAIVDCEGKSEPCVIFEGKEVPLVPRVEEFGIGFFGNVTKTLSITLWDVPHHGPIIPRANMNFDDIEPLRERELSIRYTGHEPAQLFRAIFGINKAKSAEEAIASLEKDFDYGGQNWVFADSEGHIGWTQTARFPKRAPDHEPWLVMPGDGSAEWIGDMDPVHIPHAFNPAKGYIATANNDPIGVTRDDDPFFGQPTVAGSHLYLGAIYEPGPRIHRITERIEEATSGDKKIDLDEMQSIQADTKSVWGETLQPTLLEALKALRAEIEAPGTHPELSSLASGAAEDIQALIPAIVPWIEDWSFEAPSGAEEEHPNEDEIRDSRAMLVFSTWLGHFFRHTLGDELRPLSVSYAEANMLKLVAWAATKPEVLATGIAEETGDSILFDDLETPGIVESKLYIASKAIISSLGFIVSELGGETNHWRWGDLHTAALNFFVPNDALKVPLESEHAKGFPRRGGIGTVDVAGHSVSTDDYSSGHGPAMRFVCEMTPEGPRARNALPGGQIFDPASPHYRDQMELWRKNQSFDLAFTDSDVAKSAQREWEKNQIGRIRFIPR